MSSDEYRRGSLKPVPWKDKEGFDRYFCGEMRKFSQYTTEQVMEYDRSMRQAEHEAYLSRREADPSLPIRYPTVSGMEGGDAADFDLCYEIVDPGEDIGDPEEISDSDVITEGSSSPDPFDYYPKLTVLRRINENPSPNASTEEDEAATSGEAKKNPSPHASTEEDEAVTFGKNPSPHAFTHAFAEEDEAATFGEAKKNPSPHASIDASNEEDEAATFGKDPSPHASTDAAAEKDEATTFGETKKNLHFLPRDSPPDYASVNDIAKFKRMRNGKKKNDEQKPELPL